MTVILALGGAESHALPRQRSSSSGRRAISYEIGAGVSSIKYKESGSVDYSTMTLTAKFALRRPLSRRWSLALSGYGTLTQLSRSDDIDAKFFGANGKFGFALIPAKTWSLTVFGGAYYTTMIVADDRFGFRDMAGPQIYPLFEKLFRSKHSIALYAKYSPVTNKSKLSLKSNERAFGGAFSMPLDRGRSSLSLGVDAAMITLLIDGVKITSRSLSAGLTLSF